MASQAATTNFNGGGIFIVELAPPFEYLQLQDVPQSIGWDRVGVYAELQVPGLNDPKSFYISGKDTVSFKVTFFGDSNSNTDVLKRITWLQSLVANDSYNAPVRRVKIIWGDIFGYASFVVRSATASLSNFHQDYNSNPKLAEVDLTFSLVSDVNRTLKDIRQ